MDGHFTRKMTLGPMFVKALRSYGITAPLDVQLTAVDVVDTLIEEFAAVGANYITFHPEGSHHVDRSLGLIKSKGLKCGLVLNPATPTTVLENVMDKVDIILLMSINPGFPGEKFNEGLKPARSETEERARASPNAGVYAKAEKVRAMIDASGRDIRLEIDGAAAASKQAPSPKRSRLAASQAARASKTSSGSRARGSTCSSSAEACSTRTTTPPRSASSGASRSRGGHHKLLFKKETIPRGLDWPRRVRASRRRCGCRVLIWS